MPDDKNPDKINEIEPLEALPEDLGLEDEIRQISRKVKRIMKRVEAANEAVRAMITPETETKVNGPKAETAAEDNSKEPPESV